MKLCATDRVAVISPASQQRGKDRELLAEGISVLAGWGLAVINLSNEDPHLYLAATDGVRASSLIDALLDPSIKAIFCTRGGYGSQRLIPYVRELTEVPEKFLVGYSDITTLHSVAAVLWPNVVRVHGPNIATAQFLGSGDEGMQNRESLRSLLFASAGKRTETVEFLQGGHAIGPIEGGCLSLLASSVGTGFLLSMRGAIAFIEDTGEPPYRIDRMLTQLKNAGIFRDARGIVFGEMHRCADPYNNIKDVLRDVFQDFRGPIAFGLRSGHGPNNISLRLGQQVCLDSSSRSIATIDPSLTQD